MQSQSLAENQQPNQLRVIMPNGIIGFNDLKHYLLTEIQPSFWELKSVEDHKVKFMMVKLSHLSFGEITYETSEFDRLLSAISLGLSDVDVYLILSVDQNDDDIAQVMTVNLRAPFIYHPDSYRGWQLVLADQKYPIAQVV